ncbi:MAG: NUDIX domain-containing protein [Clostridia bacterium]|nr:NUDIX domain-containing protein [Clostridia bacterium]
MAVLRHEKSCGAIVLRRDKKDASRRFLLVIRQYHGGPASFPKGHVEDGETERETAVREVFEETAVKIKIERDFRQIITYSPTKGVEKDVVYFIAETEQLHLRPRHGEIAEAFWVDTRYAVKILEHENDRCLLRKALEYIKNEEENALFAGK